MPTEASELIAEKTESEQINLETEHSKQEPTETSEQAGEETESEQTEVTETETSDLENSSTENTSNEETEDDLENQMMKSPQNGPEDETEWAKFKKDIEKDNSSKTITVDADVTADLDKDAGQTINIKANQNIVLHGSSKIEGIGFSSFNIANGGSLTIDGPSFTNAQIISKGNLILKSGKISDTTLEGPTIFVNAGTFTMNGGVISGNEVIESSTPQPEGLKNIDEFYQYSPITVYGGTFTFNAGTISGNKSFLKGGAIGAWGTDSSRANVVIAGGEISGNQAEHTMKNERRRFKDME